MRQRGQQRGDHRPIAHGVPWNAVFWLLTLTLFGAAGVFTALAESQHAGLPGGVMSPMELEEGEEVEVVLVLDGDEVVIEKDGARTPALMLAIKSFDPVVNEREITTCGYASVNFLNRPVLVG